MALYRARGFSIVTMMVILVVLSVLQAGAARLVTIKAAETRGRTVGGMVRNIKIAIDDYLEKFTPNLLAGTAVTDGSTTVANPLSPTLAELSSLGFLHAILSPVTPIGGNYNILIEPSPSSCVLPGSCNLQSTVWLTNPLLDSNGTGFPDIRGLGAAMEEIGADGGWSDTQTPDIVRGLGGWIRPNNQGAVAGIVMAIGGVGSSSYVVPPSPPDLTPFFRRDGSTPLTGNADGGGNAWSNLSNVSANEYGTPPQSAGGACTTANAVAYGAGVMMMCISNRWVVVSNQLALSGTACTPLGAVAISSANGAQLICRNNRWTALLNSLPSYSEKGLRVQVQDGSIVPKPVCDTAAGEVPAYSFEVDQTIVDVTVAPPLQAFYVRAQDQGAQWLIIMHLKDNAAVDTSANPYSMTATFKTECHHP